MSQVRRRLDGGRRGREDGGRTEEEDEEGGRRGRLGELIASRCTNITD